MTSSATGPTEPFARPPRTDVLDDPEREWTETIDVVDRWATAIATRVRGISLDASVARSIEIRDSVLDEVDLSGVRIESLSRARLVGCKLTGADLSGAACRDVELRNCVLTMANLRLASIDRVALYDCVLDEVDLYGAGLFDVDVAGSDLSGVNVEAARFDRVDLHLAKRLGLVAVGRLAGCRISEDQIYELAPALAVASGAQILISADHD